MVMVVPIQNYNKTFRNMGDLCSNSNSNKKTRKELPPPLQFFKNYHLVSFKVN